MDDRLDRGMETGLYSEILIVLLLVLNTELGTVHNELETRIPC